LTTAKLALKNLGAKRELPIDVLVGSMGIPLWGRSMVKLLVEAGFDSLGELKHAKLEQLSAVPGVGPTRALAFVNGVSACWNVLMDLLAAGVTVAKPPTGRLKGTTMCMTGFRDGALAAAFEAAGGSVKGSVGRGLTYLVAADPSVESGKLDKARGLGVAVVSRDDMWAIVKKA
jgi:DNA ligase (NAD+)